MSRTIVWDVDDVLNHLTRSWLDKVWTPAHSAQVVRYEDLHQNPPHALLGIGMDEYLSSLDEFRLGAGYAEQAPNADILAWLQANGQRCRHIALTATPLRTAPTTAAWALRHFGRWIREFAFIPAQRKRERLPLYDADKGAWLARLRTPAILVDDSPNNVEAAIAAGTPAVAWPCPWNDSVAASDTLYALDRFLAAGAVL